MCEPQGASKQSPDPKNHTALGTCHRFWNSWICHCVVIHCKRLQNWGFLLVNWFIFWMLCCISNNSWFRPQKLKTNFTLSPLDLFISIDLVTTWPFYQCWPCHHLTLSSVELILLTADPVTIWRKHFVLFCSWQRKWRVVLPVTVWP